jgi:TRAP-type C4-dicarboxylate transport system permease small subunit
MQTRSRLSRISDLSDNVGYRIEKISGGICVFLYASMFIVAILGVFFRYIMTAPFQWTEELGRYLLIWMAFPTINIAQRKKEHISILFLVKRMPAPLAKATGYLVDLLIALFLITLLWYGYRMTMRTITMSSTLHISMAWIYMSIPVAAFLTLVQLFIDVLRRIFSDLDKAPNAVS